MNASLMRMACLAAALAVMGLETGTRAADGPARLLLIDDDLGMDKREVRRVGTYMAPGLKFTDPDAGAFPGRFYRAKYVP